MPRQNRVNPFGEIIATQERGTFMGNRGVLHDEEGRIQRSVARETVDRMRAGVSGPQADGDDAPTITPNSSSSTKPLLLQLDIDLVRNVGGNDSMPSATPGGWKRICSRPQPPRSTTDCILRGWPQTKRRRSTWRTWPICQTASSSKLPIAEKTPIWSGMTGCSCGRQEGIRDRRNARKTPKLRS